MKAKTAWRNARVVTLGMLAVVVLALLPLGAGRSQAAGTQRTATQDDTFFPAAVWYGGGKARAPMMERLDATSAQRWGKDLDLIKEDGFNTVKTWVDWATAEPQQGQYNFANLDLLLKLAQERGLRVIIQIYMDSAPDWVGRKFPDARFVDRSGAVIDSQSAPGYCIDHKGVRNEMVRFLQALSADANKSQALLGWDVWSEPHVINWAEFPSLNNPEFCFCDSSQARFREWLKEKYKTLDAINAAWYRNFTDWEQVQPPRYPTILSYTDYLDWRAFIDDKMAGDLKTRVDAIRTADTTHPITSHAAAPGLFTSPTDGYGEPDDYKMSASADYFGTSLYPKHSESTHPWSYQMLAAGLDFTRSAGHSLQKGFWIGELQAGQGATGMRISDTVNGHDERYWMWQVVAHGARELAVYAWYPMSSGFESNGYGLINLDGTLTERSREAGKTANALAKHGAEILQSQPAPAQVALLYNRLSYMVGGSQPNLSKLGNGERDSLLGYHRVFFEQNIPVDFVSPAQVAQGQLDQYKILYLPFPVMLSKDVADGVKQYVERGGTVVAEARLAWNDARGFASDVIPGSGLAEVFGAKENIIAPSDNVQMKLEPSSELPGIAANTTATGEAFEEQLQTLAGGKVLAHFADGQPAIVEKTTGKGKAILIGSFVGLRYHEHQDAAVKQLVLALATASGVSPEVQVTGNGTSEVEVRRLIGDGNETVLVFNHGNAAADATIRVRTPWAATSASDVETDAPVPLQSQHGGVSVRKQLEPGGIWVFNLRAS